MLGFVRCEQGQECDDAPAVLDTFRSGALCVVHAYHWLAGTRRAVRVPRPVQ